MGAVLVAGAALDHGCSQGKRLRSRRVNGADGPDSGCRVVSSPAWREGDQAEAGWQEILDGHIAGRIRALVSHRDRESNGIAEVGTGDC